MTDDPERSVGDPVLDRAVRGDAAGRNGRFGELGERFDRGSPFWIGLVGGLGLVVAYVLWVAISSARGVLLLTAAALVTAIGLDQVVSGLQRRGVPRRLGVVLVSLGALAVLGGFLALAIPPIVDEVKSIVHSAPHYVQSLQSRNSVLGRLIRKAQLVSAVKKALSSGGLNTIGSGLVGAGRTAVSLASGILIVVALTLYFLADMPRLKRVINRLTARSRRARTAVLVDEIVDRVGGYVLGNVLTSVIAALGTLVWLEIFSVPYPVLLALFVGFMDLIPMIGSTIGGIVVSLVALTVSFPVAVGTAIFYIVYRNAEDYLITPRVMKHTVRVPGIVTVIAVLIGGTLLGIIGALIAIPIAAAIQLIVEEVVYPRMDLS